MPDRRTHRGPHPEDARMFAAEMHARLSQAVGDLCWLLSRGYAPDSSLKLVGDRHGLVARQRVAVARCSCSDADGDRRGKHEVTGQALHNQALKLDGYNVLTTIEAALSGGVILSARDGAYRDMAGMHGTYRKVAETLPALELLGRMTAVYGVAMWIWYLDRPVSNSGRLRKIMADLAVERNWAWQVECVQNPDEVLAATAEIIVTADSVVLDRCQRWFNLTREVIGRHVPQANVVPVAD